MGSYVYALNTNVRTISGQTVGVAEYRYKESFSVLRNDNEKWYNKLCARRVAFFDNNPSKMPTLMTFGDYDKPDTLCEGREVYICAGSCFGDGITKTKVGYLRKVGRSWTIEFIPNADKMIQIHKDAMAHQAAQKAASENNNW